MILGPSAAIRRYHAGMFAPFAIAALAYLPGDGIKSVRWDLTVPITLDMRLVDEGVNIDVCLTGPLAVAAYAEARRLVLDEPNPPGTLTPIQQCGREAKDNCGAAGVKSVTVTANPDSCSWTCYPPSTSPHPPAVPPTNPPIAPGAGA